MGVRTGAASDPPWTAWRLGDLLIDVDRRQVSRDGAEVRLPALSFDLLVALVTAAPKVQSLDALMDRVWPGQVVSPETVNKRATLLREALGDDARQPRYIASVRGRGYRIVASVSPLGNAAEPAEAAPTAVASRLRRRRAVGAAAAAAVIAGAFWYFDPVSPPERPAAAEASLPARTIAVLPFLDLSADASREYIATGIAEAVLHQLASLRDMTVIARTSSFAFRGEDEDVRQIGRKLNARYLLEGSVQSTEDRLRVTAQLVDATTGGHVWSLSFDRTPDDIFAVQDEIALKLAESFELSLDTGARDRLSDAPPDLEAYQHYLIGREVLYKREHGYWDLAPEQFSRAIAIDPQYAEAHAELALVLALTSGFGPDLDDRRRRADRAQEAIDTALELKPDLARAYVARGLLLHQQDPSDQAGAEAMLRKALTLEPNMADATHRLVNALDAQGRFAEAFAARERAARIDPLASPLIDNLAMNYAKRGDFERAERMLRKRLGLPQPPILIRHTLWELYTQTGRLAEANDTAKRQVLAETDTDDYAYWLSLLAFNYARLGLWESAEYWMERHEREGPDAPFSPDGSPNRPEMLRLGGRFEELADALQVALEGVGGEITNLSSDSLLRYGALQALAGDHPNAIRTFESFADSDNALLAEDPAGEAQQALAWVYLESGEIDQAQDILQKLERRYRELRAEGFLHVSGDLFLFAQNALLAGHEDLALDRLQQAVDAGWRDYYVVNSDPRWQAIRDDPRFKELMAVVKADIDTQRARVELIDAGDDFAGRLDKALAAAGPK